MPTALPKRALDLLAERMAYVEHRISDIAAREFADRLAAFVEAAAAHAAEPRPDAAPPPQGRRGLPEREPPVR